MSCPICALTVSIDDAAAVRRAVSGFLTLSEISQTTGASAPVERYCPRCLVAEMAAAV